MQFYLKNIQLKFLYSFIILFFSIRLSSQTIENEFVKLQYNKNTLNWDLLDKNGLKLVENVSATYFLNQKIEKFNPKQYTVSHKIVNDSTQKKLIITGKDAFKKINFEQIFILPNNSKSIIVELVIENISQNEIKIYSLEPLRIVNQGKINYSEAQYCQTNGFIYYDAGHLQRLDSIWTQPSPYGETKGGFSFDKSLENSKTLNSWWNIQISENAKKPALSVGYLLNANSLGRIQVLKNNNQSLSLIAESIYNQGFTLFPNKKISSDKIVMVWNEDVQSTNNSYTDLMQNEMHNPISQNVTGWCNWFYTYDTFSSEEIYKNANFVKEELLPYGMDFIQIDEGFQTAHGNWNANERFNTDLQKFSDSIHHLGLKFGIWVSPFVISENTDVYKNHKDWLIKDNNGEPVRIGPWPSENTEWFKNENPKRYCLDITHPDAEIWYRNLINEMVNKWHTDMIKVDFVAWTVFSATNFYDKSATPAQVYRKAIKIMREISGNACHILDCGPGQVSGGYINSMRSEYDQYYGLENTVWDQYFQGFSSSAGALGKRSMFHNKTWSSDIDHICVDILNDIQTQSVITLIGLSGSNIISGDRLINLTDSKLYYLKKTLPATPQNASALDLEENDPPTIFNLPLEKNGEKWQLVALLNPNKDKVIHKNLSREKLHLEKDKKYLVFDFWNEKYKGELIDSLNTDILPGGSKLFRITPKTGFPQIIGTNRHLKQGIVELDKIDFNQQSNMLSATSFGPVNTSHDVYIYIPDGYNWSPKDMKIYQVYQNYEIRSIQPNVLRLSLHFKDSTEISWKINFEKNKL